MAQTPREVVDAAVKFRRPERLPVIMDCLGCSDIVWVPRKPMPLSEGDPHVDEWGCAWASSEIPNMGQVKDHPLAGVQEHQKLRVPDYDQDWIYQDVQKALRRAEQEDKYTQAGIIMTLFERMHFLAGFENVLMGLIADRENAEAVADKVLNAQLLIVRNMQQRCGRRLHSFFLTDDWGSQRASLIGMELWYDFFLPRYRRLFDAMHAGGQAVWMHTCGKVNDVIQGLIDAGLDVVSLQQPRTLGIEGIGRRYRGQITFESLADIQASLSSGRLEPIQEDVTALAEHWMLPQGGFMLRECSQDSARGAHPDAWLFMYRAFSYVSEKIYGNPLPEPKAPPPQG